MSSTNALWFRKGLRDGMPIAAGYLAVAFALGISAKNAGLSALQAMLASLLLNASAGEFIGFTLIAAGASYLEVALMTAVANARYLLMSCALSQKLPAQTPMRHRLLIGYDVTDEIFGISISVPGQLNPFYPYGAMALAIPGWAIGTFLGVVMGSVLPARVVSALSVALYGMFIAIVVPPAQKSRTLSAIVVVSMGLSYALWRIDFFNFVPSGVKIILLTVVIAGAAAVLFPIKEGPGDAA